jgi:hypothetical protein
VTEKKMTPEEMRVIIEQERQGRIEACTRELQIVMQPVLEKYRCSVMPEIIHRGDATISRMVTVAND